MFGVFIFIINKMSLTKKTTTTSNAKRLDRVERVLNRRKPEMKVKYIDATEVGLIASSMATNEVTELVQGDNRDQRIGSTCKIMKIEVDWYSGSNGTDIWLLSPYDAAEEPDPVIDMLDSATPLRNWKPEKFQVYRHEIINQNNHAGKWVVNFPNGKLCRYEGTNTSCENRPIFFVIVNYTGSNSTVYSRIKVHFLDT